MGKGENASYQHFSPFPTMFSKVSFSRSLKVEIVGLMNSTLIYIDFTTFVRLRYPYPEDRIFNRATSDISHVLRETTLTISDSFETGSPAESK